LSGFEVLTSTKDEDPVIYTFGGLVPEAGRYASPEVAKSGWDILKKYVDLELDDCACERELNELGNRMIYLTLGYSER
jgi:hypothetical protein